MMSLGVFLVQAAPIESRWWGWYLVWGATALFVVGGVFWFFEQWQKDYADEFDGQMLDFFGGVNDAYRHWKLVRYSQHLQQGVADGVPATVTDLVRQCGTWLLGYSDAMRRPERWLLDFADLTLPSAAEIRLSQDSDKARESMAHYLARVAKRARFPTPFRYWIKWRVRRDRDTARIVLALAVALHRALSGKCDLRGTRLMYVPGLFTRSGSHT